jgi:hypothetical protein
MYLYVWHLEYQHIGKHTFLWVFYVLFVFMYSTDGDRFWPIDVTNYSINVYDWVAMMIMKMIKLMTTCTSTFSWFTSWQLESIQTWMCCPYPLSFSLATHSPDRWSSINEYKREKKNKRGRRDLDEQHCRSFSLALDLMTSGIEITKR